MIPADKIDMAVPLAYMRRLTVLKDKLTDPLDVEAVTMAIFLFYTVFKPDEKAKH